MIRMVSRWLLFLALIGTALGQGNGRLQLHFVDVGQGDGAVLISPGGKVVVFDMGMDLQVETCDKATSYLDQLGLAAIDDLFVSHYHTDHIGCIPAILEGRTISGQVYDRGKQYTTQSYKHYVDAVKTKRHAASMGDTITVDSGANQVTIRVIAVNGAGVKTTNENDLSLAALVSFGNFRAEIGGDLSGEDTDNYADIETGVADSVGPLDVYKVHHHCSRYSTNETWLQTTRPTIGIISTGVGNTYSHPAAECLQRLHNYSVKTYWTEAGNGGAPSPGFDKIAQNIVVEVAPGATDFSVRYGNSTETYPIKAAGGATPAVISSAKFAWSVNSKVYHLADCDWVKNIAPGNLRRGDTAPSGKQLHADCPTHRAH